MQPHKKQQKNCFLWGYFYAQCREIEEENVKQLAFDGSTPSLNALISKGKYSDIRYGIKLANRNIGFNGKFYTFPYFLGFFLNRFLRENNQEEVMRKFQ